MKIKFDPPCRTPIVSSVEDEPKPPILCPNCGSDKVWVHTIVSAYGWVNLNTWEVDEPEDGEIEDTEYALEYEGRCCYNCQHEWKPDGSDANDDGESMYPIGFIRYD